MRDLTGMRSGRLVVRRYHGRNPGGEHLWECVCDCGSISLVQRSNITNGHTLSCGCLKREKATKHGGSDTRLYRIWSHMRTRCNKEYDDGYHLYGGRGVSVCPEWESFPAFLKWAKSNGYEDDLTLDRIDTNGDYEPSNCRWATVQEQNQNKRNSILITKDGVTKNLMDWAEELGIHHETIRGRIRMGWPEEDWLIPPKWRRA